MLHSGLHERLSAAGDLSGTTRIDARISLKSGGCEQVAGSLLKGWRVYMGVYQLELNAVPMVKSKQRDAKMLFLMIFIIKVVQGFFSLK